MFLSKVNSILSLPFIYELFANLICGNFRTLFVDGYVKPKFRDRILDIGCGPANIIKYLPDIDYTGIDISQKYIDSAIKRYGSRGSFLCENINNMSIEEFSEFDIVIASGVIHHLNDSEAFKLFDLARSTLKGGGRLITLDGCYVEGQSRIARFMLTKDRGQYVRTGDQYIELASRVFTNVNETIRTDLLRIPYTHIIMECTK
jgi:SAM-dependent methyltransferase